VNELPPDPQGHWQRIYSEKAPEGVSWYQPHLERSLSFIHEASLLRDASIVDVGGGAATLIDDLIQRGYENVTVIDIAEAALERAKSRLGVKQTRARWIVGDVTTPLLPDASVDFWHDRAVFHFLIEAPARAAYIEQVTRTVRPGGFVLVATFAPNGPERCSGLPVARYDAEGIHRVFGDTFQKVGHAVETHETPWGSTQAFAYCFCRRA